MFRIKVCGLTTAADARLAVSAGADAIGLNFYPVSPRFVGYSGAGEIVAAIGASAVTVGVFVNAAAADVARAFDELQLDLIQLHGDEPPELLAEFAPRPVVRAFRPGPNGLATVAVYLDRCRELGCLPRCVLLDAFAKDRYGGTGTTADWDLAARYRTLAGCPPLVLAGGLNPDNVAAAIERVRPAAVDTASGVEDVAGRKEPALMLAFASAARGAFARLDPPER